MGLPALCGTDADRDVTGSSAMTQYDAKASAAVKAGILSAHAKLSIVASNVKFSMFIATVVFPAKCSAIFFKFMKQNGYEM